jgi:photosystem II stability/assembly factor-like uncharacterized protein
MLALLLAGCGGDGDGAGPPPAVQHAPVISNLKLSPENVVYMAGGGEMEVSAELTFSDAGKDIQTLWVAMPDGTRLEFSEASSVTTGKVSEQIALSTSAVGTFTVEVWLIDSVGDSSNHLTARFVVLGDVTPTTWTKRLSGVPFALNDVVFNGTTFIAVGDGGGVLTSTDGIDWVPRDSGTGADLTSVASMGVDVVAVGSDATVLLSNDDGASWSRKFSKERVRLAGVAVSSSQIIAGGMDLMTGNVFIIRSRDGGGSWTGVESWPRYDHFVTDIVYANGIFVAGTYAYDNDPTSVAYVMVSTDGAYWNEVAVSEAVEAVGAVWHHGNQFVASGPDSTIFVSADAYNWTELQTPVDRVEYLSSAWNGSRLVVAGGITWWYWWFGTPSFERPVGLTSTDGGATWEIFNIDGYYQSNGMAWGNGRFVSVGASTPVSGEGAIYSWD